MSFLVDILHASRVGLNDTWRETFLDKSDELFGSGDAGAPRELSTTHAVQAAQAMGDFPGCDLFLRIVRKIGMPALVTCTNDPSVIFAMVVSEKLGAVFTEEQACDLLSYRYDKFKNILPGIIYEDPSN